MQEHRDLWIPSPSAGRVRVAHLDLAGGLEMVHGGRLSQIQVGYESWGKLNATRDNGVLVIHPLAMDCHATKSDVNEPLGWWEPLIGPGRAIDTERFFVVCPNLIGGCFGTTGPLFPAPDGEPYLERFPLLTPLDMMRVQQRFLRELGIERLHTVIGPSLGAMIAWEWAIEGGESVDRVVVVAAPLRTTAYQIGLNWLQRRGIELDLSGDEEAAKWGQMVARGVGMLSYRSNIGIEEKFGREWFKKPGATLDKRGMYNIESWLRHHGKRSVKRFDPYTYLLFTRAMDLHDVGKDRGGVVPALDRVRADVQVVGISSDQLYPAADVHLGADILEHLGKRVSYSEIRSPHGHDGFLLETDQLSSILALGRPDRLRRAARRDVETVRLGVLGAGKVAAQFLKLLEERRERIRDDHDLRFEIGCVAEINRDKQLDPVFGEIDVIHDPAKLVDLDSIDAIVDLTRGTGSHALVQRALERSRPVVTPNKPLIREHGPLLQKLALENGVHLAYHNSIAAGWPLLYAVEGPLGRHRVSGIQALVSIACTVILERIEQGMSFQEALVAAQDLRVTEPDPILDVSGWDTAQKLTILTARAHGARFNVEDLEIQGIADLDPALIRGAVDLGYRVKLIGLYLATGDAPVLAVLPTSVTAEGHLGGIHGDDNVVVLEGEAGEMVFLGKGAGELPVASAVLVDLIGLYRPGRSWTRSYPRARQRPRSPEFARFLQLSGGQTAIVDTPAVGTVPLLDSLIQHRV